MKTLVGVPVLACLLLALPSPQADEREWLPLFNGRDLDGWTPKITGYPLGENALNTFRVADGLLQVRYDEYETFGDRFGHLFYKDSFSHYVIAVEYRFVGEQAPGGPGWAPAPAAARTAGRLPASDVTSGSSGAGSGT